MDPREGGRRLIVNADDFGRSQSINLAVVRAHREGILTSASLMVNEPGFDEAVALARECPRLGVGLHLTLVCGQASLPATEIPGLVDSQGRFPEAPVVAGCRYFFRRGLRTQLAAELGAQFARFRATGLELDHVNGHLHLHLHPVVLGLLLERARDWGINRLRVTRDPFWLNARLAGGRWMYRIIHAVVHQGLSARAAGALQVWQIRHPSAVFGLLQHGRVDEAYVTRLIPALPRGDSELYSHPSLGDFRHEFDALISPRVKGLVMDQGIRLIRYQDL